MTRRQQIMATLKVLEERMDVLESGPHEPEDILDFVREWWDLSFELDRLEAALGRGLDRFEKEKAAGLSTDQTKDALKVSHLRPGRRP